MLRLGCVSTNYMQDLGLSHIFFRVWRGLGTGIDAVGIVPACAAEFRDAGLIEAVPPFLQPLFFKSARAERAVTQARLLRELKRFEAVYLFPAVSPETTERVRQRGVQVVLERVNCAQQTAKTILDDAYRRLGLPPAHNITAEGIEKERTEVEQSDYLMCPSPFVRDSFLALGVPPEKLILSSYGWSPDRFPNNSCAPARELFTVLFVGRVCVRKGAHLLLAAWARANIRGRLILCGDMEPTIARVCKAELARSDVSHLKFSSDVRALYQNADVFAFPSLEEGGPLVTYEAMAHGMPVITSPMGAGAIVRDGIDGRVLEPNDMEAWIETLQEFAGSAALRRDYGAAAKVRAKEFTWDRVAAQRGRALLERLGDGK